jgi:hypothetical protein
MSTGLRKPKRVMLHIIGTSMRCSPGVRSVRRRVPARSALDICTNPEHRVHDPNGHHRAIRILRAHRDEAVPHS